MMINIFSITLLILVIFCEIYLWIFAIASIRKKTRLKKREPFYRFAITIPAHDEETVIRKTIESLQNLSYPDDLFTIFVVADYCSDNTAQIARKCGARCYERYEGERCGKGSALKWLFSKILKQENKYDAVIIFDADTSVDADFLNVMNTRLAQGAEVIQGKHIISNPHAGWFPALSWSMMSIDNRLNNQGRTNLHLSAKHMGDSICFRSEVLLRLGWGSGLTDDFQLRLKLLMENIKIQYEPNAIGYGQAPINLNEALIQRSRWIKGISDSAKIFRWPLFIKGIRELDWSKLDAVLYTILPSYSTLSLISIIMLILHLIFLQYFNTQIVIFWLMIMIIYISYPFFGLVLEKAPRWSYIALLLGPFYMLLRTWLRIRTMLNRKKITWIRTPHRDSF